MAYSGKDWCKVDLNHGFFVLSEGISDRRKDIAKQAFFLPDLQNKVTVRTSVSTTPEKGRNE